VAALCALAALPAAASAKEPRLTVGRAALDAAITCHGQVGRGRPQPIVFAPGTGSDGSQVWALGQGAFEAIGRPLCTVSFPDRTTADVQVSVQYLVHAIRVLSRRAGRPVAVAGVSQGGLLARFALTSWPSLRSRVSDVVTAAATHHGALGTAAGAAACLQTGCPPAVWQQGRRSRFLAALNDGRDETPGPTAWTTVRSATDEVVRPQTGPSPTSSLAGATNLLIQRVCPGRATSHIGTAVDSVTIAALADAVRHRGPARAGRLPGAVCAHPYGTGLDEARTSLFLSVASRLLQQGAATVPLVRAEPRVRAWVRGRGARGGRAR
jgi:triacylglycerol lipase